MSRPKERALVGAPPAPSSVTAQTEFEPQQPLQFPPSMAHYYVDEAGDPDIFKQKGKVIIGTEGCSRNFILGLLEVKDPNQLAHEMYALRAVLCADPYFKGVPSFDPRRRRTSLFFHAKDDPAEVRREVFHLLLRQDVKFSAVMSDKQQVLEKYIRPQQLSDHNYRYKPNEQYDYHVKCLCKNRLHKNQVCNIVFADRGSKPRTEALRRALQTAQEEMLVQYPLGNPSTLNVSVGKPTKEAGLQAVDYFLWAVQRLYEKREDRYYNMMLPQISFINDRKKEREGHHGGTFYTRKKPLTLAALPEEIAG